jgi:DCC1-like thiol-disulfide oxidoreductase
MGNREILLVYDEECPLCDAYCRVVRLRESVGELRLVNAREDSAVMKEITRQGLDIDQGMVLKVDGVLYYGSDAIHALSLMSSASGAANRINHWIFRSKNSIQGFISHSALRPQFASEGVTKDQDQQYEADRQRSILKEMRSLHGHLGGPPVFW